MRISVVDVGSNTVRLVVADAEGGVPLPVHTAKWRLRLSDHVRPGGPVPEEAVERVVEAEVRGRLAAAKRGVACSRGVASGGLPCAPKRQGGVPTRPSPAGGGP